MLRFVHTADWQLGMAAAQAGAKAGVVREARLEAAREVVRLAREAGAELLLLAGDTFEHHGVEAVLVQQAADLLDGFGRPVFVLPGNHDPSVPGGLWEHPAWGACQHVRVLREPGAHPIPGGVLFACPVQDPRTRRDPCAWIPQAEGDLGLRVGLAHGSLEGLGLVELDLPIPRDTAARRGLDYLALGHWHSRATFEATDGAERTVYPGTHEPTSFGERDSGQALLVEIEEPGARPTLRSLPTARLTWLDWEREIAGEADLRRVLAELEGIPQEARARTLLRLTLRGVLEAGVQDLPARMMELGHSRLLLFRLDDIGLAPAPGDTRWIEDLPVGPVRDAAARLCALADPAAPGPDAARAADALRLLWSLSREVAP